MKMFFDGYAEFAGRIRGGIESTDFTAPIIARTKSSPLSEQPEIVKSDKIFTKDKGRYLRRYDRNLRTLLLAGDSEYIHVKLEDAEFDMPRSRFAEIVIRDQQTLISMGMGKVVESVRTRITQRIKKP